MYQQKIRAVAQAQAFRVGEQMGVRVVIRVVKVAVLNRQFRGVAMAIAGSHEGRAVIQLADPVVGRGGSTQARVAGVVEDALLSGKTHHIVVYDAAVDWRYAS